MQFQSVLDDFRVISCEEMGWCDEGRDVRVTHSNILISATAQLGKDSVHFTLSICLTLSLLDILRLVSFFTLLEELVPLLHLLVNIFCCRHATRHPLMAHDLMKFWSLLWIRAK